MFLRNLLLVIGFTALAAGALLAALWISAGPRTNTANAPAPIRSILIAAHPIATGSLLRPDDLAWKDIASADVSPTYLVRGQVSEDDYAGAVARRDFAAGEPLVGAALVKRNDRGFLAAVLAPGKRAISIAVDAPQSSSGLVLPGDHVDIILTQHVDESTSNGSMVGETVLGDLRVIAVDQALSAATEQASPTAAAIGASTGPKIPKTITLEVTQHEAEMLSVAGELGKLQLSVRALEAASLPAGESEAHGPTWAWDVSAALNELRRAARLPAPQIGSAPSAVAATVKPQPVQIHTEVMHGSKIEIR